VNVIVKKICHPFREFELICLPMVEKLVYEKENGGGKIYREALKQFCLTEIRFL
jgi:hypothetical protein